MIKAASNQFNFVHLNHRDIEIFKIDFLPAPIVVPSFDTAYKKMIARPL